MYHALADDDSPKVELPASKLLGEIETFSHRMNPEGLVVIYSS